MPCSAVCAVKLRFLTQRKAEVPDPAGWLSRRESAVLETLRFPRRRDDWLLGRWTAKAALRRLPGYDRSAPGDWEVLAEPDGSPAAWLRGARQPLVISLSHRRRRALCAIGESGVELGCDLELVEPRSAAFEETYFTAAELHWLHRWPPHERARNVTLLWSAKESVLKALRLGLKADTRRVGIGEIVAAQNPSWGRFKARDLERGEDYHGWWREEEGLLLTLASRPRARGRPKLLQGLPA